MRIIVFLFTLGLSASVLADGTLALTIMDKYGFNKVQVKEADGLEQGIYNGNGGSYDVGSYFDGSQLYIKIGNTIDTMTVKTYASGYDYVGRFWNDGQFTSISARWDKNGNIGMNGTVSDSIPFKLGTDVKNGEMWMTYQGLYFSIEATPKKGPGTFKGTITVDDPYNYEEVATIVGKGTGSFETSLFTNANDLVSWVVHANVIPDNFRVNMSKMR